MSSLRFRIALSSALLVLAVLGTAAVAFGQTGGAGIGPRLAGVAALAIGGAVGLAFLIADTVTRPLDRLRSASRALAAGTYSGAVSLGGGREVSELANSFNEMAARLNETMLSLEQARSPLEALLAASRDAIVALDAHGEVRYLNPAAVALYGEVAGRAFTEVARDPAITGLVRNALPARPGVTRPAESGGTALISLDDRGLWLQVAATPIAAGGGWAVLLALHDVTEARRAETTRRDFVANVSHELRTPLAGIKAVVETLQDGALDDRAVATEFLTQVDGEVDRLVQLVEELLQLARIESGGEVELRELAPQQVLNESVERFRPQAERAGVTLALSVPAPLPAVRGNAAQLAQAVGNLVHNAIKFTPAGGHVEVSASDDAGVVRIQVRDTGFGIEPNDLPRIFERFYVVDRARSARGTGLGLAIVKHVALAHHGRVEAQSTPGAGSTFTLTLPAA